MDFMLFRKLLALLAVGAAPFCTAAHAQFGVFGTVTGARIGNVTCTPHTTVGTCASGTTTDKPYGANFGGYYEFRSFGPVRFGVEIRGGVLNANKDPGANIASSDLIREYTALGGVRGSVGTPIHWLRPYAEFAAGYAKFGPVYAYNTYTKAEGLVGVDVPVAPFLDIRAIELGAGALFGNGTHGTQSIGAGLVFHTLR